MRQECIQAVQQAALRTLTAREIQNIEDRIYRNMRSIARDDPMSWRQLNEAERLRRAGQLAAEELQREAALKNAGSRLPSQHVSAWTTSLTVIKGLMESSVLSTALSLSVLTGNQTFCLLNPAQKQPVIMR